jgi:hypothetical protein
LVIQIPGLLPRAVGWEATLKLPSQPSQPMTGFWMVTQTKQKDGNWKWAMEGYNVKMPPPAKTQ